MFNLQNRTRTEYSAPDLERLEDVLRQYRDKSTQQQSESISDLEKHLWLANGAALTVSIGFIQAKTAVHALQITGTWLFLSGIFSLLILKYLSSALSSRDRARFQEAKSRFDAGECTDEVFRGVRDARFRYLKAAYLALQWFAGLAFLGGCVFTVSGVIHAV